MRLRFKNIDAFFSVFAQSSHNLLIKFGRNWFGQVNNFNENFTYCIWFSAFIYYARGVTKHILAIIYSIVNLKVIKLLITIEKHLISLGCKMWQSKFMYRILNVILTRCCFRSTVITPIWIFFFTDSFNQSIKKTYFS